MRSDDESLRNHLGLSHFNFFSIDSFTKNKFEDAYSNELIFDKILNGEQNHKARNLLEIRELTFEKEIE